jgi:uncharacterized protein with HEPN domain
MSSERKWAYRIEHILDAIAKIQRYTAGMDEVQFVQMIWLSMPLFGISR